MSWEGGGLAAEAQAATPAVRDDGVSVVLVAKAAEHNTHGTVCVCVFFSFSSGRAVDLSVCFGTISPWSISALGLFLFTFNLGVISSYLFSDFDFAERLVLPIFV